MQGYIKDLAYSASNFLSVSRWILSSEMSIVKDALGGQNRTEFSNNMDSRDSNCDNCV